MATGKRQLLSKGKGYLSAAGPQARFIVFLFGVLITYTFILMVFRKLAEMLQLPLFFPIALVVLVVFVGVVGTLYSHKFIGPLSRIRSIIERLAKGDTSVSLRVRESDDPVLKDLAAAISLLCDHTRNSYGLMQEAAKELAGTVTALQEKVHGGAGGDELRSLIDTVRKKQEMVEQAVRSFKKSER